jgi:hypothetical protein
VTQTIIGLIKGRISKGETTGIIPRTSVTMIRIPDASRRGNRAIASRDISETRSHNMREDSGFGFITLMGRNGLQLVPASENFLYFSMKYSE